MKKILVTGGHPSPALALIDDLGQSTFAKKMSLSYVGAKYIGYDKKSFSLEYKEVNRRSIPFFDQPAGRMTRIISLRSFLNLLKIPLGFFWALLILRRIKPDLIMSFGGYIALPVTVVGFFLAIPIFTHEQTIEPGLANKFISLFAKKIFVSFQKTRRYFPRNKTIYSGNLLKKSIFEIDKKPFIVNKDKPVIYITGGSLGSHSLNIIIEKIISRLLQKYIVIHQTGDVKDYSDFARLSDLKDSLSQDKKVNYFLVKHIQADQIGYVYSIADIVLGRSGANTFFEVIALAKPTIFVPLPWSASDEQYKHAKILQENDAGLIFDQKNNPDQLLLLLDRLVNDFATYKNNFKNLQATYLKNASRLIIAEIFA